MAGHDVALALDDITVTFSARGAGTQAYTAVSRTTLRVAAGEFCMDACLRELCTEIADLAVRVFEPRVEFDDLVTFIAILWSLCARNKYLFSCCKVINTLKRNACDL